MNKTSTMMLFCLMLSALAGCAQVEVLSVDKMDIPEPGGYYHPRLDGLGTRLLLTAENYAGLQLLDLQSGRLTRVSEGAGAGYSPVFTPDGSAIVYVENEFIRNLKYSKLLAYRVDGGRTELLEPAARSLTAPMVAGNRVHFKADNQLKSALIGSGAVPGRQPLFAGIEEQQLVLYRGGVGRTLTPYEGESYIWPSVSPDGKRILAYAMGKGAFVCDTAGLILAEFGLLEAPVWAGDKFIAGMETRDDGHRITASSILLAEVETGKKTALTPEGIIALHPSVSPAKGLVVFHTPAGEIYQLRYHVRR